MSSRSGFQEIQYDVVDGIATVTLDRPDQLNAFTDVMRDELVRAFDQSDGDDDVRAVVVTGSGRAFCAGADLSGRRFGASQEGDGSVRPMLPRDRAGVVTLRIFESLKPVIAAINGSAVGVGATMPLAMDVRLASSRARCAFAFGRRGIVPDGASSWFLPRIVGIGTALEWSLTGRMIGAEEMVAAGLVSAVHEPDELAAAARAVATEIATNVAPVSAALTRQLLWQMLGADHPMVAHLAESRGLYERTRSADATEGIGAFLDKRVAQFPLRVSQHLPAVFDHAAREFPVEEVEARYAPQRAEPAVSDEQAVSGEGSRS